MKSLEDTFAVNMINYRKVADMSQAELARETGISASNISAYELGYMVPTLETIQRVAKGVGVSPLVLLNGAPYFMDRDQLIYLDYARKAMVHNRWDLIRAINYMNNHWNVAKSEFRRINRTLNGDQKNQALATLVLPFLGAEAEVAND